MDGHGIQLGNARRITTCRRRRHAALGTALETAALVLELSRGNPEERNRVLPMGGTMHLHIRCRAITGGFSPSVRTEQSAGYGAGSLMCNHESLEAPRWASL
jgi:hypothetical protein